MARKSIHNYFKVINKTTEQHAEEADGVHRVKLSTSVQ